MSTPSVRLTALAAAIFAILCAAPARTVAAGPNPAANALPVDRDSMIFHVADLAHHVDQIVKTIAGLEKIDRAQFPAVNPLTDVGPLRTQLNDAARVWRALRQTAITESDQPSTEIADSNLALITMKRSELTRAKRTYLHALNIGQRLNDKIAAARIHSALGRICSWRGDLDDAESMHLLALDGYDRLGLLRDKARTARDLAKVYEKREDLDNAINMHRLMIAIHEQLDDDDLAYTYAGLAWVLKEKGDLAEAAEMYLQAVEHHEASGQLEPAAFDLSSAAWVYDKINDVKNSVKCYQRAIEIHLKIDQQENAADTYFNLGLFYMRRDDFNHAEETQHAAL
ncbi:MAG: hypothetical protein CMJ49_14735, partial [Planctomycetaceae bacterium]|nr:hypothetical protein [Planctomycetaceae bacterium]